MTGKSTVFVPLRIRTAYLPGDTDGGDDGTGVNN